MVDRRAKRRSMRVEPGEARGRVSGGGAALTNESSVSCWAGEKDERIANMSREVLLFWAKIEFLETVFVFSLKKQLLHPNKKSKFFCKVKNLCFLDKGR